MEQENFPVKYCLSCKQVYELIKRGIEYYADFPTLGLERENCCNCKK